MKIASHNVARTVDGCLKFPTDHVRNALVAAFDWRPIEEAEPFKQPGCFIVALFVGFVAVAYWDADEYSSYPKPFWFARGRNVTTSRKRQPTHFMLVPEIGTS